ncbi:hypothetical protein F4823DRAFT_572160 [Ustulina deusta]|nr:hypothetical protein F4823DRAFT_572160 [Ustulina deusta]
MNSTFLLFTLCFSGRNLFGWNEKHQKKKKKERESRENRNRKKNLFSMAIHTAYRRSKVDLFFSLFNPRASHDHDDRKKTPVHRYIYI